MQEVEAALRETAMAGWIQIYQSCPSLMCIQEGNLVVDLITLQHSQCVFRLDRGDSNGNLPRCELNEDRDLGSQRPEVLTRLEANNRGLPAR